MALSDCSKCWETPCVCGNDYKHWSLDKKAELMSAVSGIDEEFMLSLLEYKNKIDESEDLTWE